MNRLLDLTSWLRDNFGFGPVQNIELAKTLDTLVMDVYNGLYSIEDVHSAIKQLRSIKK